VGGRSGVGGRRRIHVDLATRFMGCSRWFWLNLRDVMSDRRRGDVVSKTRAELSSAIAGEQPGEFFADAAL
jgi:hypothetical protein